MEKTNRLSELAKEYDILLVDNCSFISTFDSLHSVNSFEDKLENYVHKNRCYSFWLNSLENNFDSNKIFVTEDIFKEEMNVICHYNFKKSIKSKCEFGATKLQRLVKENLKLERRLNNFFDYNKARILNCKNSEDYELYARIFPPIVNYANKKLHTRNKSPLSKNDIDLFLTALVLEKENNVALISNDCGIHILKTICNECDSFLMPSFYIHNHLGKFNCWR